MCPVLNDGGNGGQITECVIEDGPFSSVAYLQVVEEVVIVGTGESVGVWSR